MEVEAPRDHLFRTQIIANGDFAKNPSTNLDFIPLPMDSSPDRISSPSSRFRQPRIVPRIHKRSPIHPLISQQTQRSKALLSSIDTSLVRKLKEKDEEIHKMATLNRLLGEKVRSLMVENHLWRDLAQTNEHDANSLRSILEHVLTRGGAADDGESCCGSNDPGREEAGGGIAEGAPARPPRLPGMPTRRSRRGGT